MSGLRHVDIDSLEISNRVRAKLCAVHGTGSFDRMIGANGGAMLTSTQMLEALAFARWKGHRLAQQATQHVQRGAKWGHDYHGLVGEAGVCAILGGDAFDGWKCENHTGKDDGVDLIWTEPGGERVRVEVKWTATNPPRLMFRERSHFAKSRADLVILCFSPRGRLSTVFVRGFVEISKFAANCGEQENGSFFMDGKDLDRIDPLLGGMYLPERIRAG